MAEKNEKLDELPESFENNTHVIHSNNTNKNVMTFELLLVIWHG